MIFKTLLQSRPSKKCLCDQLLIAYKIYTFGSELEWIIDSRGAKYIVSVPRRFEISNVILISNNT